MQRQLRALSLALVASLGAVALPARAESDFKAALDKELKSPDAKKWKKQAADSAKAKSAAAVETAKKNLATQALKWKKRFMN